MRDVRPTWVGWSQLASLTGVMLALGCHGPRGNIQCRPDPITGSEYCQTAGSETVGPAVTTGVAAGVYAVAGCTLDGCQFPDRCNTQTKRCEPIACAETKDCPSGYHCSMSSHLCR